MTFRTVVVSLALGLSAAALQAQTPVQAPPVFTSTASIARLDVQVVDASGQPIRDLRADEFQVVEGGSRRPVMLLQHVADAGRTFAESAMRTIASEVSTNQGAPRGQLYVLLFDQEHITAGAEQKVRLAAARFIKEKLQPQDRVAIFGVPQPGPALTFTNNTRTAIEQLQSVRGSMERLGAGIQLEMTTYEAFAIQRGSEEMLNRFLSTSAEGTSSRASALVDSTSARGSLTESPESLRRLVKETAKIVATRADGDSRRFLQVTSEILRNLRYVDGRKNIILFSEGFFGDNLAQELRSVASAAAEVYGVVYAFDLGDRVSNMGEEARGNDTAAEALARTESIGGLAADTDGALIPDALGHLDSALAKLATPSNDYYIVGFEPSAGALSDRGGYRKVDVKVTRAGATVRTRTGYSAGADTRTSLPGQRRLSIDSALAAPFGHQGLRVEYTTYQTRGSADAERIVLSLETELPVAEESAKADVVFVVRNIRTGQVATSGADDIALPATPDPGRATGTSRWRVQFLLPPGEYLMRCIVREPGGLLGSADRQFAVRSLSGPDVAASDLLIGMPGQQLPVRATAYTGEPFPGTVRLFGRSRSQLDDITARLELIPTGGSAAVVGVAGIRGDITSDLSTGVSANVDLFFEVPLTHVPPGDYVARAEIRASGELLSELRRQVTVVAGTSPPLGMADARAGSRPEPAGTRSASPSDAASTAIATSILTIAPDGVAFLKSGRYADAVAALSPVFEANPKSAAVAFLLGWAHRGAGSMTSAISAFRNAALLDPSMIPAHLALADTYLQMKQPALAVQALEAGLASQPNAIELKHMLETIKK